MDRELEQLAQDEMDTHVFLDQIPECLGIFWADIQGSRVKYLTP